MRAKVNGTELFFDVEGSGLVPEGPTMVERPPCLVLHGGPGMDHSYYRPWLSPLTDTVQLIYMDHRGQGRSQRLPNEAYTIEHMADDLEQLRLYLGLEQPIVMGNSFGGMLALVYATRYPGSYSRLVLISTTASYDFMAEANAIAAERATPEQQRVLPTIFEGKVQTAEDYRHWWDVMLPLYFHRYDPEAGAAMLGRTIGNPEIARHMFAHEIPHYDVRPRLDAIGVPTLVISGRHDWITPPTQGQEIHSLIPGSEFTIFEHSGHMPFVEEQEAFLSRVRGFLTRERAQAAPALSGVAS